MRLRRPGENARSGCRETFAEVGTGLFMPIDLAQQNCRGLHTSPAQNYVEQHHCLHIKADLFVFLLSCCALKEKGYFPLSIKQCEVTKLAVEGAPREFRINEECFHGMPLIILLSHINGCQDYCAGPLFLKVLTNFCRNLTVRHLVDCLNTYDSSAEIVSFKTFF